MALKHDFFNRINKLAGRAYLITFVLDTYPQQSAFRNFIYLFQAFLTMVFGFLWLEYTRMDGLFKSVYPVILAVTAVGTQYLAVETGGRFIFKRKGAFTLTMAGFWAVSFAGVCLGFLMVYFNAQCPGIEKFYPDIFYFYTEYPGPRPSRMAVFYKIILVPWCIANILLTQREIRKKQDKELAAIKSLNAELKRKQAAGEASGTGAGPEDERDDSGLFRIATSDGVRHIAFDTISSVSVKDHYCELIIKDEAGVHREFARLSLKEAADRLPDGIFEQVHRSHIVNLSQVEEIIRKGQAYRIRMQGMAETIPASRHRARDFLPKLEHLLAGRR